MTLETPPRVSDSLSASFYVTGGSLPEGAPSYVARRADAEFLGALLRGECCYVLDTRQVGKSSLLVRAAAALRAAGRRVVALDLSAAGRNLTPEQWYFGLLYSAACQLGLEGEIESFWEAHQGLGPAQRWAEAWAEVVLPAAPAPLILFVDEIDAVRGLPFGADEFFAALRALYNRRALDPLLSRLTFCLTGVATPADLIQDPLTTPFNIGRRIELEDFAPAEAEPLAQGLGAGGDQLLKRVLHWTGGHPYLTQRLCRAAAEAGAAVAADVDRACTALFLAQGVGETDPNLAFARDRLLRGGTPEERATALALYAKVRAGRAVFFDPSDPAAEALRLAGVVRVSGGSLQVRNRVYARAFGRHWAREARTPEEIKKQRRALRAGALRASAVWVPVVLALLYAVYQAGEAQAFRARAQRATSERDRYGRDAKAALDRLADVNRERDAASRDLARIRENLVIAEVRSRKLKRKVETVGQQATHQQHQLDLGRGRLRTLSRRVEEMAGEMAASLANDPNADLEALEYGLRAVGRARSDGRLPAATSIQGLAAAVNRGAFRRLTLRHPEPVLSACFSPDGRRILTAAVGRYAYLWDARTGAPLARLTVQDQPARKQLINTAEFSRDGRCILTASDVGGIRLWDSSLPGAPLPLRDFPVPPGERTAVVCAALSPDGHTVAVPVRVKEPKSSGSLWYDVRLFDVTKGTSRLLAPANRHTNYLWTVAFSPDGSRIATASADATVRVWDVKTGGLLAKSTSHDAGPERSVLAAQFDATGNVVLAGGKDHVTRVWHWLMEQKVQPHLSNRDWVWNAYGSPDGSRVATACKDGAVAVWPAGAARRPLVWLGTHGGDAYMARFSPDGREVVTAGADREARVWRLTARTLSAGGVEVNQAAYSPDARLVALALGNGRVRVEDARTRQEVTSFDMEGAALAVAFAPGGRILAAVDASGLALAWGADPWGRWQKDPLWRQRTSPGVSTISASLAFSRDRKWLAIAGPGASTRVLNAASGEVYRFPHNTAPSAGAAFTPDGLRLLAAFRDNRVFLMELKTGRTFHSFLPPGRKLAQEVYAAPAPNAATLSPDGQLAVLADSGGQTYMWEVASGRQVALLKGTGMAILDVNFSPDGKRLATAGADGAVRLWDIKEAAAAFRERRAAQPLLLLRGHAGAVRSVRFSPDGSEVLTASADLTARVWPVTAETLTRQAEAIRKLERRETEAPEEAVPGGLDDIGAGSRLKARFLACYLRNGGSGHLGAPADPVREEGGVHCQRFHHPLSGVALICTWDGAPGGKAFLVQGNILQLYEGAGGFRSWLGLPLGDEADAPISPRGTHGRVSRFEKGYVYWDGFASRAVPQAILAEFLRRGGIRKLGYPTGPASADGRSQAFENGTIQITP